MDTITVSNYKYALFALMISLQFAATKGNDHRREEALDDGDDGDDDGTSILFPTWSIALIVFLLGIALMLMGLARWHQRKQRQSHKETLGVGGRSISFASFSTKRSSLHTTRASLSGYDSNANDEADTFPLSPQKPLNSIYSTASQQHALSTPISVMATQTRVQTPCFAAPPKPMPLFSPSDLERERALLATQHRHIDEYGRCAWDAGQRPVRVAPALLASPTLLATHVQLSQSPMGMSMSSSDSSQLSISTVMSPERNENGHHRDHGHPRAEKPRSVIDTNASSCSGASDGDWDDAIPPPQQHTPQHNTYGTHATLRNALAVQSRGFGLARPGGVALEAVTSQGEYLQPTSFSTYIQC